MNCTICGKTAMRHGTKGRAYCFKHDEHAHAQMRLESRQKSVEADARSDRHKIEWQQERRELGL
jgi:hypothetical protein